MKKSVDHMGNEYKSLAEMLREYKISKSQYGYRQKKGWDIERILTTQSDKCHVYDHKGVEYSSTKAMCECYDIPYDTFLKRISKYNMPLEKALTKRVKNREMLAPNGTAYNSKAKMCNAYGISVRTYNSRVDKLNWDCQKALETKVKHISRGPYYDHTGQGFRTLKEMCEKWKISVSTYTNKISLGYSVKDALTLHTENYQTSFPEHVIYYYCRKVYSDALIRKKLKLGVETEIDIYLPSLGIGIEHDCAIFHSKEKDAIKYQRCRQHNIFLVRITDDVEAKEGVTCDKLIKYIPYHKGIKKSYEITEEIVRGLFDFLGKSVDVDLERDDQDIYKQLNEYILERSLGNQYPELVERYWDYARNKVSPFNISSHSNNKHYFIVDGVPSKRIVNNAVKTFVKRKKLYKSKTNGYKKNSKSLQQMFQDFVEIYWDYENNTISPDEVKPYSNKDVYLLIDGKSVLRSINTAVRSFEKGSKLKRFISLEEKYPNFVKNHWDFEKNIIKPNEIAYGSHKEVYLIFDGQSKNVKLFTRNHSMKD